MTHEYRSAALLCGAAADGGRRRRRSGEVGELDPTFVETFGLVGAGRAAPPGRLARPRPRRPARPGDGPPGGRSRRPPVSRFPSSDIDLAFVVPDEVPAGSVEADAAGAGGELLESVRAVRRLPGRVAGGRRAQPGLPAAVLRLDRTLTDEEIGTLRAACIAAVEQAHRATLR